MSNPLVSITMLSYNVESFIEDSIKSIVNQSYTNIELIIVDDYSMDNTRSIVKSWAQRDDRIRYFFNTKNQGIPYSRNLAIKNSRGEYIAILDSDDIAVENRIKDQVEYLVKNPKVVGISGQAQLINKEGDNVGLWQNSASPSKLEIIHLFHNYIIQSTVLIKSNIISKFLYNEEFTTSEDYELWSRLIYDGFNFEVLPKVFCQYRIYSESTSREKANTIEHYTKKIIERNLLELFNNSKDIDIDIHRNIGLNNYNECHQNIKRVEIWLLKLYELNSIKNRFKNDQLKKYIGRLWFLICYNSTSLHKVYRNSKLFGMYRPPILENVKYHFLVLKKFKWWN